MKKLYLILILLYSTLTANEAILKLDTKGHTAKIWDIIVTKSGDILSASDDKTIRVWDSTTGKEKRKILGQIGTGAEGKIYAMVLSPNEEFLAIGGYLDKNRDYRHAIRIYNYKTGTLLKVLKSHTDIVNDLAFSSDGKYLISSSGDFTAKIWQTEDFSLRDTIKFHTKYVTAVKIIKNRGDYFAVTAGYDNQIALYDMAQRKVIKRDKKNYKLQYLAVSQNHIAVCGFGKKIAIYDLSLNPIKTIISETKPAGLAYSPNGEFLIAGVGSTPNNVNIYSVKRAYQKIQSFQKHKNLTNAVAFLDNQTAISAGGNNNEIYIWKSKTAQVLKKIEGVGARVWSVGVDGESVAWGNHSNYQSHNSRGELQKSINLKTLQIGENLRGRSGKFKRISTERSDGFSLRHRAGGDYGVSDAVLDIKRDGRVVASIIRGATNGLSHRCYGFYKEYIISGGANGFLKIYNLQGQEVVNLVGHTGEVWSIALDGDRLVSGSDDQTIRIWDLSKLKMKSEKRKINEISLAGTIKMNNLSREKVLEIAKTNNNLYNATYISLQIQPQLTLFTTKENRAIAWTPQGFYNASKGAEQYIGFHINHGAEHEAEFLEVGEFREQLHRPDIIAKVLKGEDIGEYAKEVTVERLLKGKDNP